MTELVVVLLAGVGAGMINAVVGSGTLITFPVLVALGYPPVTANISNNLGLVPGAASATWGYRRELAGQGGRARLLAPASLAGAAVGAVALLRLPKETFAQVVPVLIVAALVLVVVQPRLQRALAAHRDDPAGGAESGAAPAGDGLTPAGLPATRGRTIALVVGIFVVGVYGGYFGAAQGIMQIAVLGSLLPETLQRCNALKNLLSIIVTAVAGLVFCVAAWNQIDWTVVSLIAVGSIVGGVLGARYGRRLPATALRAIIIVVGLIAVVRLVAG